MSEGLISRRGVFGGVAATAASVAVYSQARAQSAQVVALGDASLQVVDLGQRLQFAIDEAEHIDSHDPAVVRARNDLAEAAHRPGHRD